MPDLFDYLKAVTAQHNEYASKLQAVVTAFAEPLKEFLSDRDTVRKKLDELPIRSKSAMQLASANGWFFGWAGSLPYVDGKIDEISKASPDEVDTLMADHFKETFDHLLGKLCDYYPQRAAVLLDAAQAHSESRFSLSVPVFIAQGDRIFSEVSQVESALQKELRRKGPQKPEDLRGQAALKSRLKTQRSRDLLHPLFILHSLDFLKSSNERRVPRTDFTALNRHQVMHGETSDYGTELNSLRAFSFLAFCGVHLPNILELEEDLIAIDDA